MPIHDTYHLAAKALGELRLSDEKGEWTFTHVLRHQRTEGGSTFYLYLSLRPLARKQPAAGETIRSDSVVLYDREDLNKLKERIRECLKYTPVPHTMWQIWTRFKALQAAYEEEDSAYAGMDQDEAKRTLARLHARAIERYSSGEVLNPRSPVQEKYLTTEEHAEAVEAQKVMNGHSFVARADRFGQNGHLSMFGQALQADIEKMQADRDREQRITLERQLREKLEHDVPFRSLVAHALAASQEIRAGSLDTELAHRLFGYTQQLEAYQRVYRQYDELIRSYGLGAYEARRLVQLGRSYQESGELLPVVQAPYERREGQFYFGDIIHDGERVFEVQRVGRQFVYLNKNRRMKKQQLAHFEPADPIAAPQDLNGFLFNEGIRYHNLKWIPNAQHMPIFQVVRLLAEHFQTFHKLIGLLRRKAERLEAAGERHAILVMVKVAQIMNLKEQMVGYRRYAHMDWQRAAYVTAKEELTQRIEELKSVYAKYDMRIPCEADEIIDPVAMSE